MNQLKGPVYFEIKNFITNNDLIEFNTLNDKIFRGKILWYENNVFHIELEDGKKISLFASSVVYYSKI